MLRDGLVCGPEEISVLRSAFDEAWQTVEFAYHSPAEAEAVWMRKTLAESLLAEWRKGRASSPHLATVALKDLPPLRAIGGRSGARPGLTRMTSFSSVQFVPTRPAPGGSLAALSSLFL